MAVAKRVNEGARVIAHVDMDCFYVQVEQRKQPALRGVPTAVVQYNSWKGGGLIAVGYEARRCGVKRSMRGEEAKKVCPDIQLIQVPVAHGKADLSTYRNSGSEVVSILSRMGVCERASIDEVYLDITEASKAMLLSEEIVPDEEALKSHITGLSTDGDDHTETVRKWMCRTEADHMDKLLACGALIISNLRTQVLNETEFTCSAGVAHNKMLAKLASAMNKPAQQTVVPSSSVAGLLHAFPIEKMKGLGGKLGSSLQAELGLETIGDLLQFSQEFLQSHYGVNAGQWLWNMSRGICCEEVKGRLLPKSHASGKTFSGCAALNTLSSVEHWVKELSEELSERIAADAEKNRRVAHTLTLQASARIRGDMSGQRKFPSKSCPIRHGREKIREDAFRLFRCGLREFLGPAASLGSSSWAVTSLSISAAKILAIPPSTPSVASYFTTKAAAAAACSHRSSMEGIDESVFDQLPPEIQEEIRPTKRPFPFPRRKVTTGIHHYFPPQNK